MVPTVTEAAVLRLSTTTDEKPRTRCAAPSFLRLRLHEAQGGDPQKVAGGACHVPGEEVQGLVPLCKSQGGAGVQNDHAGAPRAARTFSAAMR